jgi:integrase
MLKRRYSERKPDAVYVFPSNGFSGNSPHIVDLRKPWNRFRKAAGIQDVTLHDIRRTCGAYRAMSGESLQAIAKSLGQTSTTATPIYARLSNDAIRETNARGERKMLEMMRKASKRLSA